MIVIWKKNSLKLLVLDVTENRDGEPCYAVCKEGADPKLGQFNVRQDDVVQAFS